MLVSAPVPGTELLNPSFLSNTSIKSISSSNMWFATLVPDTQFLNPLDFLDESHVFCSNEVTPSQVLDQQLVTRKTKP